MAGSREIVKIDVDNVLTNSAPELQAALLSEFINQNEQKLLAKDTSAREFLINYSDVYYNPQLPDKGSELYQRYHNSYVISVERNANNEKQSDILVNFIDKNGNISRVVTLDANDPSYGLNPLNAIKQRYDKLIAEGKYNPSIPMLDPAANASQMTRDQISNVITNNTNRNAAYNLRQYQLSLNGKDYTIELNRKLQRFQDEAGVTKYAVFDPIAWHSNPGRANIHKTVGFITPTGKGINVEIDNTNIVKIEEFANVDKKELALFQKHYDNFLKHLNQGYMKPVINTLSSTQVTTVMQIQPGIKIDDFFKTNAEFLKDNKLEIMSAVVHQLQSKYHNRQWVHCDIKPGNILINQDPDTKKISAVVIDNEDLKIDGSPVRRPGSPAYIAPELKAKKGEINYDMTLKSDVYATGLTLLSVALGREVTKDNRSQALSQVKNTELHQLLTDMTQDNPKKRPDLLKCMAKVDTLLIQERAAKDKVVVNDNSKVKFTNTADTNPTSAGRTVAKDKSDAQKMLNRTQSLSSIASKRFSLKPSKGDVENKNDNKKEEKSSFRPK